MVAEVESAFGEAASAQAASDTCASNGPDYSLTVCLCPRCDASPTHHLHEHAVHSAHFHCLSGEVNIIM